MIKKKSAKRLVKKLTKEKIKKLMACSNIDPRDVLEVCQMQDKMDPFVYFGKAVLTEREHGIIGTSLGTDIIGINDEKSAKIALAHLFGVEWNKKPSEWEVCPYYYHYLWEMEKHCYDHNNSGDRRQ